MLDVRLSIYRHKHELKNQSATFYKMSSSIYFRSRLLPRSGKYCQLVCEKSFLEKWSLTSTDCIICCFIKCHASISFQDCGAFLHIFLNIDALENLHASKKFDLHNLLFCILWVPKFLVFSLVHYSCPVYNSFFYVANYPNI